MPVENPLLPSVTVSAPYDQQGVAVACMLQLTVICVLWWKTLKTLSADSVIAQPSPPPLPAKLDAGGTGSVCTWV